MAANNGSATRSDQRRSGHGLARALHQAIEIKPGTVKTLLPDLIEAMRLHLGMEVGFLSEFREGRRVFKYVSHDGEQGRFVAGDSDPLEETYCLRVVEGRIPGIIHNAREFDGVKDLDVTQAYGIGAHASVPVFVNDGQVYGTLSCFSTQPDESLGDRDLDFMLVISELVGSMIEQQMSFTENIEQQQKYIDEIIQSGVMSAVWQPIVDADTGEVLSVEALARFDTVPYRPPNEWFEEAVRLNRYIVLERNALINGLKILPDLPGQIRIGCNLSGQAFLDPKIQKFLSAQALDRIVLEITEHDIIDDYDELARVLAPLREQGLMLAIDDFGSGYASFRHILRLDPDIIKLDLKLVRDINISLDAQSVVRAMSAFAAESSRSLVAEGVETQAELDCLRLMGITQAQGNLIHKPMNREHIRATLKTQSD